MENSTVAQASEAKKTKVQLTWEAPNDSRYGDVYFSVSVVQDYTTFWVQVNSSTLRRVSSAAAVCSSPLLLLIGLLAPSVW
ncbi:unnamed protein product [Tetraodon nigroviridis]|nr:unnamed protein product [Tetraodon nigroviridis]